MLSVCFKKIDTFNVKVVWSDSFPSAIDLFPRKLSGAGWIFLLISIPNLPKLF